MTLRLHIVRYICLMVVWWPVLRHKEYKFIKRLNYETTILCHTYCCVARFEYIKVISLGLGLTMSILLFSRVAFEQSYDTCYKDYDDLYQIYSIFSAEGEQFEPQKQNCGPVAGAILENFPKEVEAAASIAYFVSSPLTMAVYASMPGKY